MNGAGGGQMMGGQFGGMQNGNSGAQMSINGARGAQGGQFGAAGAAGGSGNARQQLANLYQQTGGAQNQSVRQETHQLVQLALGGGGGGNLGSMVNGNNPMAAGQNPNFGGLSGNRMGVFA